MEIIRILKQTGSNLRADGEQLESRRGAIWEQTGSSLGAIREQKLVRILMKSMRIPMKFSRILKQTGSNLRADGEQFESRLGAI